MDQEADYLIAKATTFVQDYMASFDPSHDYSHIIRVLALAEQIMRSESDDFARLSGISQRCSDGIDGADSADDADDAKADGQGECELIPSASLRRPLVVLGVLLHDVNDHKYRLEDGRRTVDLYSLLTQWGANDGLACQVDQLCQAVSYSTEIKHPQVVKDCILNVPELAVVQDADRLDAIGAIGMGRCFTFGGSRGRDMGESVRHFEQKLLCLEGMMKTRAGREMARIRTARIREFMRWWNDESELPICEI